MTNRPDSADAMEEFEKRYGKEPIFSFYPHWPMPPESVVHIKWRENYKAFFEGRESASVGVPERWRSILKEIVSALDEGLGDSDITHIESDEELREQVPVQWACMHLSKLLLQSSSLLPADTSPPQPEREPKS